MATGVNREKCNWQHLMAHPRNPPYKPRRKNLLRKPNYSKFCPKFCCHGNEGRSGKNAINSIRWPIALHFSPSDPRCHGNEIWVKIGYNSVRVRDFREIFASIGGFLGMGHWMLPIAFLPTDFVYHGNKILDKIGYNSVTVVIGLATVRKNLKRNLSL